MLFRPVWPNGVAKRAIAHKLLARAMGDVALPRIVEPNFGRLWGLTGAAALLIALAGCGGSSGGGQTGPIQSFADTLDDGTYEVTGLVRTADGGSGEVPASFLFEREGGRIIAVAVEGTGVDFEIDTRDGDSLEPLANNEFFLGETADDSVFLVAVEPLEDPPGFTYQTYGHWVVDDGTTPRYGAGSFGAVTPVADMPARISTGPDAVFEGVGGGWLIFGNEGRDVVTRVMVTTDFDQVEFRTSGTEVFNPATRNFEPNDKLDLGGSGDVSGNGFSITVATVADDGRGPATGRFYGPGAEEVGGTFEVMNDVSDGIYLGAFGAVR